MKPKNPIKCASFVHLVAEDRIPEANDLPNCMRELWTGECDDCLIQLLESEQNYSLGAYMVAELGIEGSRFLELAMKRLHSDDWTTRAYVVEAMLVCHEHLEPVHIANSLQLMDDPRTSICRDFIKILELKGYVWLKEKLPTRAIRKIEEKFSSMGITLE